jgi:hypothetical protein
MSSASFADRIRKDAARYKDVVRDGKIRAD